MFQLKTLRSKNYTVEVDRWWSPADRRAARLLLAFREHEAEQLAASSALAGLDWQPRPPEAEEFEVDEDK